MAGSLLKGQYISIDSTHVSPYIHITQPFMNTYILQENKVCNHRNKLVRNSAYRKILARFIFIFSLYRRSYQWMNLKLGNGSVPLTLSYAAFQRIASLE